MVKMAVPIKNSCIPYLNRGVLDTFANVKLVASSKNMIKINPMVLSAFTDIFIDVFEDSFETDIEIITDFEFNELKIVADFVSEGILPVKDLSQMKAKYSQLFLAFGIHLEHLFDDVKKEVIEEDDIKVELNDEDLPLNLLTKRRKREVVISYKDSEEDSDDDWQPERKKIKKEVIEENSDSKSSSSKRLKLNRIEKSINQDYRILKNKYSHIVNTCLPERFMPSSEDLEEYSLPSPLASYISPPIPELTKPDLDKPVECPRCQHRFANVTKLQNHDLVAHNDHLSCSFCQRAFSLIMKNEFIAHIYRHDKMSLKPHECIHCGFQSYVYKTIVNHVTMQGPYHTSTCPHCQCKFKSHSEFKGHLEQVHPDDPAFICDICGELFKEEETLKIHKNSNHQGVKFTRKGTEKKKYVLKRVVCDLCGKSVLGSLHNHKAKVHCALNPQECPQCQKVFKSPVHLDAHIRAYHKKYPCDLCGIMIANKHKSRHFQQYHVDPDKRRYKCEHCGKGFSTNQSLRDHVNIHTGERPHVCKFCGKSFASAGNHQMHVRTTHLGHKRNK